MSKRYPPIFNVILFAVAVIFMLLNPISNMVPQLPEAIKTAVTVAIYAMYDFFDAVGKYNVPVFVAILVYVGIYSLTRKALQP